MLISDDLTVSQFSKPTSDLMFYGPGGRLVMRIRFDQDPVRIEVAEDVSVDEAARGVFAALEGYINAAIERRVAEARSL